MIAAVVTLLQAATVSPAPNPREASDPYVQCLHDRIDADPERNVLAQRAAVFDRALKQCASQRAYTLQQIATAFRRDSDPVGTAEEYLGSIEELIQAIHPFADAEKPQEETGIDAQN